MNSIKSNEILKKRIQAILKETGLRCTQGRMDTLSALSNADDPMTHDELCGKLSHTGINRVTVYRVLETFLREGIVHRVEAGDRVWRFAVCGKMHKGHCHPHFICRECGRVECLMDYPMPDPPQSLNQFRVEEQEFYLRGLCAQCAS